MSREHEIHHAKAWRPLIMGRNGMVAAGHPLAALAGVRVLEEGGNAVDAALAAGLTLAVVKPDACGLGGDLFSLVYMNGKVEALNASGPAPAEATIEWFRAKGLAAVPASGPLSIAVPGAVDGWLELHRRYASKELERLAREAIGYAREGFPIHGDLGRAIAELEGEWPDVRREFRDRLQDTRPGRLLAQADLARSIEAVVKRGRAGFYEGEVAEKICAAIRKQGGVLTVGDFQGRFAEWLEPLVSTYHGYTVYEQPPVSQGFMVLEMLNVMEHYPLARMERAEAIHVMVEAKKLAFADRIRHLEDPRFGDPEIGRLISKEYARSLAGRIGNAPRAQAEAAAAAGGDTDYLCAVDRDGNAVSLIQSVFASFGSRVVPEGTGVVMNNRLSSFLLDPERANALAPGKRPAHTLNSYLVFDQESLRVVGGTPGADDQPQTNVQILHNLLDLKMDPQSAIEAPRWSHKPGTPPRHEGREELQLESGFPVTVLDALRAKGHPVAVASRWAFGGSQVIMLDPATGSWMGGADPRRQGYVIGW